MQAPYHASVLLPDDPVLLGMSAYAEATGHRKGGSGETRLTDPCTLPVAYYFFPWVKRT